MKTLRILIAIDPTNSFCPGGELAVHEGDKIMPVINQLTDSGVFQESILVTERHPEGHISFAASHPGKNVFDTIVLPGGHTQRLWPKHCVEGTPGCEPHPKLNLKNFSYHLVKGQEVDRDAHSGFLDNDRKIETGLRELICSIAQKHAAPLANVELTVVGLALDYCAGITALDARHFGFKTRVVLDATRSIAQETELEMLKKLAAVGVELTTSRELLRIRTPGRHRSIPLSLRVGIL